MTLVASCMGTLVKRYTASNKSKIPFPSRVINLAKSLELHTLCCVLPSSGDQMCQGAWIGSIWEDTNETLRRALDHFRNCAIVSHELPIVGRRKQGKCSKYMDN